MPFSRLHSRSPMERLKERRFSHCRKPCFIDNSRQGTYRPRSWIHYHGHAHYERLDGLKQSLALSKVPLGNTLSTPSFDADFESPATQTDVANPSQDFLVPPYLTAKLSSPATDTTSEHQSSTHLTAAEIFSMTIPPRRLHPLHRL